MEKSDLYNKNYARGDIENELITQVLINNNYGEETVNPDPKMISQNKYATDWEAEKTKKTKHTENSRPNESSLKSCKKKTTTNIHKTSSRNRNDRFDSFGIVNPLFDEELRLDLTANNCKLGVKPIDKKVNVLETDRKPSKSYYERDDIKTLAGASRSTHKLSECSSSSRRKKDEKSTRQRETDRKYTRKSSKIGNLQQDESLHIMPSSNENFEVIQNYNALEEDFVLKQPLRKPRIDRVSLQKDGCGKISETERKNREEKLRTVAECPQHHHSTKRSSLPGSNFGSPDTCDQEEFTNLKRYLTESDFKIPNCLRWNCVASDCDDSRCVNGLGKQNLPKSKTFAGDLRTNLSLETGVTLKSESQWSSNRISGSSHSKSFESGESVESECSETSTSSLKSKASLQERRKGSTSDRLKVSLPNSRIDSSDDTTVISNSYSLDNVETVDTSYSLTPYPYLLSQTSDSPSNCYKTKNDGSSSTVFVNLMSDENPETCLPCTSQSSSSIFQCVQSSLSDVTPTAEFTDESITPKPSAISHKMDLPSTSDFVQNDENSTGARRKIRSYLPAKMSLSKLRSPSFSSSNSSFSSDSSSSDLEDIAQLMI